MRGAFQGEQGEIDGILVTLPNFGDERGIADALRGAGLDVPVLACLPDEPGRMAIEHRRDSFCGKMSACNALSQYGIRYSLPPSTRWTPSPTGFDRTSSLSPALCRVVKGMRKARFGQIGARPAAFVYGAVQRKAAGAGGISVESVDLSDLFGRAWSLKDKDSSVVAKLDEIRGYVRTTKVPRESLARMAKSPWC